MDPQRSVRIEIDGAALVDDLDKAAPAPTGGGPSRGVLVVGAVLLVVALVAGLRLLQPAEGESADGTQRQAPTTTEVPAESSSEDDADDPDELPLGFEPQSDGIVRTADGFLGLGWNIPNNGLPVLFSSNDGETWTQIDPQLPPLTGVDNDDVRVNFSKLIAIGDRFSILREEQQFSHSDPTAGSDVVVTRLVSDDGVVWENDTDVRPFRRPDDDPPLVNLAGATVSIRALDSFIFHGGPQEFTSLWRAAAGPETEEAASGICELAVESESQLSATTCLESDAFVSAAFELTLTAADVVDSVDFAEVHRCGAALAVRTSGEEIQVRQGASSQSFLSTPTVLPTHLEDGSVAWLAVGDLESPVERDPCAAFPGIAAGPPVASIEVVEVGEQFDFRSAPLDFRSIPLPEQARTTAFATWPAPWMTATESTLFAILDRDVWQLDLVTEEWSQLGGLPNDADEFSQFRITPDGRLIGVQGDGLTVIDFATGEEEFIAANLAFSPRIVYLDDELALVSADFRPGTIVVGLDGSTDLPPPEPRLAGDFANSDVVRGDTDFFALLEVDSVGDVPALYRSGDGIDWQRVAVEVPPVADSSVTAVAYSNLITTGSGSFAVLRTSSIEDATRFADRLVERTERITERLVSNNGERWVLDEAFTPVVHPSAATPAFHLANAFGLGTDPATGRSRVECDALAPGSGPLLLERSLIVHRFGRTLPSEVDVNGQSAYTSLPQSTIASFAPAGTGVDLARVCGIFPGDSLALPIASVELIAPDDSVRLMTLPIEVTDGVDLTDWPGPELRGTADGLLAIFERSVWRLDLETETWTKLVDLPAEAASLHDYRIVDDRFVVALAESVVIRVDLELGEVATNLIPASANPAPEILYADADVIITPSRDVDEATARLALPPPFFPDPQS